MRAKSIWSFFLWSTFIFKVSVQVGIGINAQPPKGILHIEEVSTAVMTNPSSETLAADRSKDAHSNKHYGRKR